MIRSSTARTRLLFAVAPLCLLPLCVRVPAQATKSLTLPLNSTAGLEFIDGKAEITTYQGRRAIKLIASPDHDDSDETVLAMVANSDFKDGTIEVEVAGAPGHGAPADARGFVGIAFRMQGQDAQAEDIYIRPTNGRADDQLRRNHSVQYESIPDFPWYRLRKGNPGAYESYADLEAGAWTKMKIVVAGTTARLYINGSEQPCLIVNDLKLGASHGRIALWAHWTTDAYFSNLTVHSN